MRNLRRLKFDDPTDLNELSSAGLELFGTLLTLDFARRTYERDGDNTSLRRAEEIKKLFKQLWAMETQGVRALVSHKVFDDMFREREKWRMTRGY